jgi:hypothetical protein
MPVEDLYFAVGPVVPSTDLCLQWCWRLHGKVTKKIRRLYRVDRVTFAVKFGVGASRGGAQTPVCYPFQIMTMRTVRVPSCQLYIYMFLC